MSTNQTYKRTYIKGTRETKSQPTIRKGCALQGLAFICFHKQLIEFSDKKINEQLDQNMGRRSKQTFLQRRHTAGQQAHAQHC